MKKAVKPKKANKSKNNDKPKPIEVQSKVSTPVEIAVSRSHHSSKINNFITVIPIAPNPIHLRVKSFILIEMNIYTVPIIAHVTPHIALVIGS